MPPETPLQVYWSPDFLEHRVSPGHPESAARLEAIVAGLQAAGLWDRVPRIDAPAAALERLQLIHPADYVARLQQAIGRGARVVDSADTEVSAGSFQAALKMAGAGMQAVDDVLGGKTTAGFVLGRPPGHHALPDLAMGFCLLANLALAARHAQQAHGLERIAVIDWDVHHGNGTQAAFYGTETVQFISLHEYPLYPGTGAEDETGSGAGRGFTCNIPLAAGAGDERYLELLEGPVTDILTSYRPDIIFISAGFDAHAADPLGHMQISSAGFAAMTRQIKQLAGELCNGRIVSFLEGGYDLEALAESVVAHVAELAHRPNTA